MSDADSGAGVSGPALSHVSTAEWQSFEVRMRRRRVQRCLLRAEIAIEAGFPEDARGALEEARRIGASSDEVERVAQLIPSAPPPPIVGAPSWLSWKHLVAAIALMAVATVAASGALLRNTAPPTATQLSPVAPTPEPAVQQLAVAATGPIAAGTSGTRLDSPDRTNPATALHGPEQDQPLRESLQPTDAAVQRTATPSEAVTATVPMLPAAPPAAESHRPASAEPTRATGAGTNAVIIPSVEPVPSLGAPPAADESGDVRAVLARYESAYSQLDPSQARAVWPGVDERALARAFGSLASQRVSLGQCDVKVNGGTARATCAGAATWRPKVGGGGPRTEARRWTFELKKSGDAWRIERAHAR